MAKKMKPVHPGEILREEFMKSLPAALVSPRQDRQEVTSAGTTLTGVP